MSDILAEICDAKRESLRARKERTPLDQLGFLARAATPTRGFAKALTTKATDGYALICEIKKASPSAGLIREDFNVGDLARSYAAAGAACLSVLTEEQYFQGSGDDLRLARMVTELPVLRKDFMVDPYQILESRALGADCILLIMAALDDALAAEMEELAVLTGMDVLIEVHNEAELERALKLRSPLIGVNNRNLKTLKVDLATTERLAKLLPNDRVLVAESGLKIRADLDRLAPSGARRFLIGESLMKQPDVEAAVRALLEPEAVKA